jgi:hypothetical protein
MRCVTVDVAGRLEPSVVVAQHTGWIAGCSGVRWAARVGGAVRPVSPAAATRVARARPLRVYPAGALADRWYALVADDDPRDDDLRVLVAVESAQPATATTPTPDLVLPLTTDRALRRGAGSWLAVLAPGAQLRVRVRGVGAPTDVVNDWGVCRARGPDDPDPLFVAPHPDGHTVAL